MFKSPMLLLAALVAFSAPVLAETRPMATDQKLPVTMRKVNRAVATASPTINMSEIAPEAGRSSAGVYRPPFSAQDAVKDAIGRGHAPLVLSKGVKPASQVTTGQIGNIVRALTPGSSSGRIHSGAHNPVGQIRNSLNQAMPPGINIDPGKVLRRYND